jgi:hypothetical protein
MGLRVSRGHEEVAAVTMRTSPPPGFPGVDELVYSGAFPVSQLSAVDRRLNALGVIATLRAYAPFEMHNASGSNVPAVVLEIEVANVGSAALDGVGFFVALPAFVERDSARTVVGTGGGEHVPGASTPAACRQACQTSDECSAWTLDPAGSCRIASANTTASMPQFAEFHAPNGSWSGVRAGCRPHVPLRCQSRVDHLETHASLASQAAQSLSHVVRRHRSPSLLSLSLFRLRFSCDNLTSASFSI